MNLVDLCIALNKIKTFKIFQDKEIIYYGSVWNNIHEMMKM